MTMVPFVLVSPLTTLQTLHPVLMLTFWAGLLRTRTLGRETIYPVSSIPRRPLLERAEIPILTLRYPTPKLPWHRLILPCLRPLLIILFPSTPAREVRDVPLWTPRSRPRLPFP